MVQDLALVTRFLLNACCLPGAKLEIRVVSDSRVS